MSTQQIKPVDGKVLLERLAALEPLGLSTINGWMINEARTAEPIAAAQVVLEQVGYQLTDWEMIERAFYQLTYTPAWRVYSYVDRWPYSVELRLITSIASTPALALVYYDNGVLTRYEGSYRYTSGTGSSNAEKMEFHFRHDHPGVEPKWLPLFGDHFPVVDLKVSE